MSYSVWAAGAARQGLSQPAWPHQWFKGCCLGWWLVIGPLVGFLNITWHVSRHVSRCIATQPQTTREHWWPLPWWPLPWCPGSPPVPRSPVQMLQAALCSCEACSRTRARGQARAGSGFVINANWIYISTFHRSHLTKNQNTVTHKLAS